MGSMFVVVVPIRDYETLLRQKEHHIKLLGETERRASYDEALIDEREKGPIRIPSGVVNIQGGSQTTASSGISGIDTLHSHTTSGDEVDVYTAEVDGVAPVRVVVSGDSMAIIGVRPGDRGFEGRRDSIGSSGGSSGRMEKRRKSGETDEEKAIQERIENIFLEKHLEDCLSKFKIMNACWGQSVDGNFSQVTFTVSADNAEVVINHLQTVGIGIRYASSICVCAASVFYEPDNAKKKKKEGDSGAESSDDEEDTKPERNKKWNAFVSSIKSRLTVAQVVQSVKANAILTFDFIVLIMVAALIAGLGLVDDSPVNVVASMLVSPLMGPIMAMTFGTVIRDWELVKIGVVNELIGLTICLFVGYFFGIILQLPWSYGPWKNVAVWPTAQMIARSQTTALSVGVMVAIPSGAGVAISILAGNSGSLVGVAISASLLPPAVNCGLLWGLATVISIRERIAGVPAEHQGCHDHLLSKNNYTRPFFYKPIYCENTVHEYFFMGLNSFGLTLINIVVIFIVGVIILKIKEVAPHTTRKSLNRFWKEDLKITREYNSRGKNGASVLMQDLEDAGDNKEDILKNLEADQTFTAVNRRAAYAAGPNIITDVRHRNNLGSMENIHADSSGGQRRGGQGQAVGGQTPAAQQKKGWLGGLFGGGGGGGSGANDTQGPVDGDLGNPNKMEEGHARHRPKLH